MLALAVGSGWSADEVTLAPGVTYRQLTRTGPVVAHVLKAALAEPSLTCTVATGGARLIDASPLPAIAQKAGAALSVAGAVNGGFGLLTPEQASPVGFLMAEGELLCDPWPAKRSCLVFGATGAPRIEALTLRGLVSGQDGRSFPLAGLNRPRLPGELVLYSPRYNTMTRTREAGRQLVLAKVFADGATLVPGPDYGGEVQAAVDGLVNVEIPADGVVLAGSGPAEAWLAERKKGERLTLRFELQPNLGPVRAALGAGPRLIRDGKISIEAEQEELGVRVSLGRQPRSAVGLSGDSLFLVAVDGRAPEYSVGATIEELAAILLELGCTQAMELDGGGATTLFARDRVVNRPSDGSPRPLSSALLLLTSGKLTDVPLPNPIVTAIGPAPTPGGPTTPTLTPVPPVGPGGDPLPPLAGIAAKLNVAPAELAARVGEQVPLALTAVDADNKPVAVDNTKVAYEVNPPELGTVDGQGKFVAKKEGTGHLTVRYSGKSLTVAVTVGQATITRPPTGPTPPVGVPPVAAAGELRPGKGFVRPRITLPEGTWKPLDGFELADNWRVRVNRPEVPASAELVVEPKFKGKSALKLIYDFTTLDTTRAAYLMFSKTKKTEPVDIGAPKAVGVWVYGDGNGHWLRGTFRDAKNVQFTVTFADFVNWEKCWGRCSVLIPKEAEAPLRWESLYLTQFRPAARTSGAIYLDDFSGLY